MLLFTHIKKTNKKRRGKVWGWSPPELPEFTLSQLIAILLIVFGLVVGVLSYTHVL